MGTDNKILVYVAGNPDAYPLEYYDPSSDSFQGVIPQLLAKFSAQSSYEIVYYPTGQTDQRAQLGKNLQVDLLSGYTQEDDLPSGTDAVLLLRSQSQGEELSYYLCTTRIAPETLHTELEQFLSALPQEAVSGLLLDAAVSTPSYPQNFPVIVGGLVLGLVLLSVVLALVVRHYRKHLQRIQQELERDTTTGLGNVDHLLRYSAQMVHDKNRVLYSLIYFCVDIDHLRRLATSQEVDDVLRYCAMVLQSHTAQTDILVRAAENGFALLQLSGDQQRIQAWVAPVLHKIRAYPQDHAKPYEIDIAVGVYPLTMGCRDFEEVLFHASQEAQRALNAHQDCSIFTHETLYKLQLEQKLRSTVAQALNGNEFQLYIQFYVDSSSFQIVGGEALSRWLHPERGLLLPGVFVPILEREGLIAKLDYHCLQSACSFLETLFNRGIQDFFLSCNFSRDTFAAADFPQRCQEILAQFQFPRELLIFELTESISVSHLSRIRSNMLAMKEYGVRIALDDFGEGFTSFADLQEYPADGIKLDKGLIDNILTKPGNAIVRAMIQVGHELGITMLAEGVETAIQAQALRDLHCDVIQGFQFYAPIPEAEAFDRLLGPR